MLHAMSSGGRIGYDAPYMPRGCDMRWFTSEEICEILGRFEKVVIVGDYASACYWQHQHPASEGHRVWRCHGLELLDAGEVSWARILDGALMLMYAPGGNAFATSSST
jgi:hypothetical protein